MESGKALPATAIGGNGNTKRRFSDGSSPTHQEQIVRAARKDRKTKTHTGLETVFSRRDEIQLTPDQIARLHTLNEVHQRFRGNSKRGWEDTEGSNLDTCWGPGGSWLVYGEHPQVREAPFSARSLKPAPASGLSSFRASGIGALNTKGRKGNTDRTIGQDNLSISRLPDGYNVVCVMDGHGDNGHWPSTRAVRTLPFFLQSPTCERMLKQGQVSAALLMAFEKTQRDLERTAIKDDVDLQGAGSTAAVLLWRTGDRIMHVATCGDSRVCALVPGKGVVYETEDHKPSVEAERKRVEAAGGEVLRTEHDDGWVEERIMVKGEDFPGICMTRSLGDLCVKPGIVTAEPQVVQWDIGMYKDVYILAASDGVWEFLSTQDVGTMLLERLQAGDSSEVALQSLLEASRVQWSEAEGIYCDDITMALVPLGSVSRSAGAGARSGGGCAEGVCRSCALM
eukprot:TRINITY_DN38361_c0_g1_i1.p1 TRINITY_DN38361_c0_g1~~TRINITY_DN38361_c0_g1_i1.p1  ORF type:complete len:469 (-),score=71.03 TRINITY_DN38361_c0_g1_i1:88-1446(-)